MKRTIYRSIAIRLAAFLPALVFSLMLVLAYTVYVNRQAMFIQAAWDGNIPMMKAMYALGVDVNAPSCSHRACFIPLVGAAWDGHNEAVQYLLDRGADVKARSRSGMTALMVAASYGHKETVQLLVSRGAEINASRDGDTALTFAKEHRHTEVVEWLRQAGAIENP
jgi:ankyrin repeat protein